MHRPVAQGAATCALLALLLPHALLLSPCLAADLEGFGEEEGLCGDASDAHRSGNPAEVAASMPESTAESSPGLDGERVEWDEDEFEGVGDDWAHRQGRDRRRGAEGDGDSGEGDKGKDADSYHFEIAAVVALLVYGVNVWIGTTANEAIALAWAKTATADGGVLDENFTLLGPGDSIRGEQLVREHESLFKLYGGGRRHCDGFLATLDLRAREDLLSMASYLLLRRDDHLNVEVYMSEGCMPPTVLAVGAPKVVRELARDCEDLRTYAKAVGVRQVADWATDRWAVVAESSEVFYDLIGERFVELVFGESAYESTGRSLRYLHFTSEMDGSSHKNVLRFSFVLPPLKQMGEISNLLELVPMFVDAVGGYRMSPEGRRRADRRRADEAERRLREGDQARRDAITKKRREADTERLKRLSPKEAQKWVSRQAKVHTRRWVKQRAVRA
ncbi:unnamed protein product [Ostreobium quekettii]|uniref:DUF1682 family protein n=1 Tax=Ostreobium quekettii TaxID=121088 RepID=A0A8S1J2N5_9CHLO|nr:unnamed protein product [Ostreobium quekettii]|eukprot:evm.model.scf_3467.1 EVM.evm.TU.scf_3467.1   scf_3467:8047-9384(+)